MRDTCARANLVNSVLQFVIDGPDLFQHSAEINKTVYGRKINLEFLQQ